MILVGIAILILLAVFAILYYRQKEKFVVVGKFVEPIPSNPGQDFTLLPMNQTYTFADPVPDTATAFDVVLSRFTDKKAPADLLKGATFPEAAPYTDSEVENISKLALSRVKGADAPILSFISVEYAAKGVDNKKNTHYDIAFMVYDQVKNFSLKLVLVAVLDTTNKLWIKKFASFNSFVPSTVGPKGVENIDEIPLAPFIPDFVQFSRLYKDNANL
ncbi:hypothetical protein PBCVIL52s1_297R [Paramecium bursaria Chlorella virus IL-5-2s1]|nr:hypothetical protein PBCVIL52s1_297R [Paramecium bursaria Chlorella virus IL-5-2s1]